MATLQALGSDETLEVLLQRFLGGVDSKLARWLLSRSDEEMLISIEPQRWFSWDCGMTRVRNGRAAGN